MSKRGKVEGVCVNVYAHDPALGFFGSKLIERQFGKCLTQHTLVLCTFLVLVPYHG